MNNQLLSFGAHFLMRTGIAPFVEEREAHRANILRILVYHRIGDPVSTNNLLDPSLLSATPGQFEQQMRYLHENYHLLSVDKLLGLIKTGEPLPPRSVMITFDDGYHDFLDTAWPVLERYEIPTIMFLATNFLSEPDRSYWWDILYQAIFQTRCDQLRLQDGQTFLLTGPEQRWGTFLELKKFFSVIRDDQIQSWLDRILTGLEVVPVTHGLVMDWDEVRDLQAHGCSMATHTRNHVVLSHVSVEEGLQQIRDSQQDIQRELGSTLPVLAYPSGHSQDLNDALIPRLRQEGFKLAMSSLPGLNILPGCNLLRLRRIGLSPRLSLSEFRLVLTGIYHFYFTFEERFFHRD